MICDKLMYDYHWYCQEFDIIRQFVLLDVARTDSNESSAIHFEHFKLQTTILIS